MNEQKTTLQKIGTIFNTSSETFMLIALISLFAFPFAIAKNLEPAVKEAQSLTQISRPRTAELNEAVKTANSQATTEAKSPNVLGANDVNKPFDLALNEDNLKYLNQERSELLDNKYALEVSSKQKFDKVAILKLKNSSQTQQSYRVSLENIKGSKSKASVYLAKVKYTVGVNNFPETFKLDANQELEISLGNDSKEMSVRLSVELVEIK
jgi:hypothetical protein